MKQFIKSDNEWVFSREYIEFQDGGPRDIDGFENANYAFAVMVYQIDHLVIYGMYQILALRK